MYQFSTNADYKILVQCDTCVVIADLDCGGRSVTNDAHRVVSELNQTLPGGLGKRSVYYRDSMSRYDELTAKNGEFNGFAPCSPDQQQFLANLTEGAD